MTQELNEEREGPDEEREEPCTYLLEGPSSSKVLSWAHAWPLGEHQGGHLATC